jgi:hypothetical protein
MSIQQFYTVAQNRDFARLFQFRIREFGSIIFDPGHFAYVETASLPGRSITNIPVTFMGMDFNTPGTVKYPGSANYTVQFRCDAQYNIRAALEAATFNLFDESVSKGTYGVPGEDYRLVLELFDKQLLTIRTYTLFGVWVQSLGDVSYDVKDTGQVQTVAATLAYQYWRAGEGPIGVDEGSRTFASTNPSTRIIAQGTQQGLVRPNSWGAAAAGQ